MIITTAFDIGEIVFLITDETQSERMITNITIYPGGVLYSLSLGPQVSEHYEIEMTRTADINKQLNIKTNEKSN